MNNFKIVGKDGNARAGVLVTSHGDIETPIFMPVGTQATVKAISPDDLKKAGAQIILGNTYHLYLRPGSKLIKKIGGLHTFMGWNGPILTDSGGFQAFSLGAMIEHGVKKMGNGSGSVIPAQVFDPESSDRRAGIHRSPIRTSVNSVEPSGMTRKKKRTDITSLVSKFTEDGVHFVSHLDGSKHLLTPEVSIEVQCDLGSDIVLVLDELLSPMHDRAYAKKSLERTHRWETRSKDYFDKFITQSLNPGAQLFGILQGVYDKEIRINEASWVADQDFSGVSIGGSFGTSEYYHSVIPAEAGIQSQNRKHGSPIRTSVNSVEPSGMTKSIENVDWAARKAINETMDWVVPILPEIWPKHALGIGEVTNIFDCVERGIDMFDCVAPTRRARNGSLYISPKNGGNIDNKFTLSIENSKYREDSKPLDPGCICYTCQNFSRSYLRHLYTSSEILYHQLATIHNVYFMVNLTKMIRESILNQSFKQLKDSWLS